MTKRRGLALGLSAIVIGIGIAFGLVIAGEITLRLLAWPSVSLTQSQIEGQVSDKKVAAARFDSLTVYKAGAPGFTHIIGQSVVGPLNSGPGRSAESPGFILEAASKGDSFIRFETDDIKRLRGRMARAKVWVKTPKTRLEISDGRRILATAESNGTGDWEQLQVQGLLLIDSEVLQASLYNSSAEPSAFENFEIGTLDIGLPRSAIFSGAAFRHLLSPRRLAETVIPSVFNRTSIPRDSDPHPRIFCLGGSTTHGLKVTPEESYPGQIQKLLDPTKEKATVYNLGVVGVSSVATNYFVKNVVARYSPDAVVIHDGYNDLPVVISKLEDGKYKYITPDYNSPWNPFRSKFTAAFVDINAWGIKPLVLTSMTALQGFLQNTKDVFLGYDYSAYENKTGGDAEIDLENQKRIAIFVAKELDTIDFALAHGIKVAMVLEPQIVPGWVPLGTGFRDIHTGELQRKNHEKQQAALAEAVTRKYGNNPAVRLVDLRTTFLDGYKKYYYDECHLYPEGNRIKAEKITQALKEML